MHRHRRLHLSLHLGRLRERLRRVQVSLERLEARLEQRRLHLLLDHRLLLLRRIRLRLDGVVYRVVALLVLVVSELLVLELVLRVVLVLVLDARLVLMLMLVLVLVLMEVTVVMVLVLRLVQTQTQVLRLVAAGELLDERLALLALLGAQLGGLAELLGRLRVALLVQRQVIGSGEGFGAEVALEGAVAGVLALVARQLVGAREARITVAKVAQVRLLTCMDALVGLQMGTFGVDFVATRILAIVHAPLLELGIIVSVALYLRLMVVVCCSGCCCCC